MVRKKTSAKVIDLFEALKRSLEDNPIAKTETRVSVEPKTLTPQEPPDMTERTSSGRQVYYRHGVVEDPLYEALRAITGSKPPPWVRGLHDGAQLGDRVLELQDWCSVHAMPNWSTGIGVLEAAELMVREAVGNANIQPGPNDIEVIQSVLHPQDLKSVLHAAAGTENRTLQGVWLEHSIEGWMVLASDGHRMSVIGMQDGATPPAATMYKIPLSIATVLAEEANLIELKIKGDETLTLKASSYRVMVEAQTQGVPDFRFAAGRKSETYYRLPPMNRWPKLDIGNHGKVRIQPPGADGRLVQITPYDPEEYINEGDVVLNHRYLREAVKGATQANPVTIHYQGEIGPVRIYHASTGRMEVIMACRFYGMNKKTETS